MIFRDRDSVSTEFTNKFAAQQNLLTMLSSSSIETEIQTKEDAVSVGVNVAAEFT